MGSPRTIPYAFPEAQPRPLPDMTMLSIDMDSAGTRLMDESGHGNHAVATGTTPKIGPNGWLRYFDGVDDRLNVADADSLDIGPNQDFTLECWCNPDSTTDLTLNTSYYTLMTKYVSTTGYNVALRGGNANGLSVVVGDGSSYLIFTSAVDLRTMLVDGTWKHVMVVFPRMSPTPLLYINGVVRALSLDTVGNGRGAASFCAANKDYLTVADNAAISATTVLYGVVDVMLDSIGANRPLVVKGTSLTTAANLEYGLFYSHVGTNFKFSVSDGANITTITDTGATPSLATWYHLEFGRKADGTLFISRNGAAEVASAAGQPAIQDGANALVLGMDTANATFHNGRLANLGLSKTIPTAAERTAAYNSGNSRTYLEMTAANGLDVFKTNLSAWWDMSETEGATYVSPTRLDSVGTSHLTPSAVLLISPTVLNGGFETVTASPELVLNPGFETGGTGGDDVFGSWSETKDDGAIADETVVVHAGGSAHALKITAGTNRSTRCIQSVSVSANKTYSLSLWTQGDGIHAGQYGVYDATHSADIIAKTSTGITGSAFSNVIVNFTIPTGCTAVYVRLWNPELATAYAYFDDVSLKLVDFANWTEVADGTSTINVETSAPHAGSLACRMDISAANATCYIGQAMITVGKKYNMTFWAKANSGTPQVQTTNGATSRYTYSSITTDYAQYTHHITGVGDTTLYLASQNAASKSIYIDDIALTSIGPLAATGPPTTQMLLQMAAADFASVSGLEIGVYAASSRWYKGLMGLQRLYKRAVGASDIMQTFRNEAGLYGVKS